MMYTRCIALLVFLVLAICESPEGCLPRGISLNGFQTKLYPYTNQDGTTLKILDYVSVGYAENPLYYTIAANSGYGFSWQNSTDIWYHGVGYDFVYGYNTTISNFTMEITGYYFAKLDGDYTISLSQIDDSAALFIGDGVAFACCNSSPIVGTAVPLLFTYDKVEVSSKVTLIGNTYYPIRIVYTNAAGTIGFFPYSLYHRSIRSTSGYIIWFCGF